MKKIKLFFAALIAVLAFCLMACSTPSSSGSSVDYESIKKPIFDSSETTLPITSMGFSDGDWIYQEIQKGKTSSFFGVNWYEITVSNGGKDFVITAARSWNAEGGGMEFPEEYRKQVAT